VAVKAQPGTDSLRGLPCDLEHRHGLRLSITFGYKIVATARTALDGNSMGRF
jgi:hypothetical protein